MEREQQGRDASSAARYPSRRTRKLEAKTQSPAGSPPPPSRAKHTSRILETPLTAGLAILATLCTCLGLYFIPGAESSFSDNLDGAQASGELGAQVVVQLEKPVRVLKPSVRVLKRGTGQKIVAGAPLYMQVSVFSARDGKARNLGGVPRLVYGRATEELLGADLLAVVQGQNEGSRLMLARPITETGSPSYTTEIDVIDIMPSQLSSTLALPDGLPFKLDFDSAGPRLESVDPNAELKVPYYVELISGKGVQLFASDTLAALAPETADSISAAKEEKGEAKGSEADAEKKPATEPEKTLAPGEQTKPEASAGTHSHHDERWRLPVVQYALWDLTTGKELKNTWQGAGPQMLDLDDSYEALRDELDSTHVGSRILTVIPGPEEYQFHPLLVLMDVLGAMDSPQD